MMNAQLNWHVVYTRPNHETKVALLLKQKGMTIYSPQSPVKQKGAQQPGPAKCLFPRWVFVYCTQEQLITLRTCNGIINVLYWHNTPAVVTPEDIATLRFVVSHYEEVRLKKSGIKPFERTETQQQQNDSFVLPSLGYTLVAHGEKSTSKDYLPTLAAVSITGISLSPRYGAGVHAMLRKLPFLLGRKITELPAQ